MEEAQAPARGKNPSEQTFYFASIGRRFAALFIDGIIIAILTAPFSQAYMPWASSYGDSAINPAMVPFAGMFLAGSLVKIIINVAYATFFVGHFGQTPGKMVLGIKVVNYDGTIPTYATALVRYLVSILSGAAILIGYIWAFFNKEHQTWHDLAAKTYVVKTK
jgi:uncharacterized RDD family membrane protein YckC